MQAISASHNPSSTFPAYLLAPEISGAQAEIRALHERLCGCGRDIVADFDGFEPWIAEDGRLFSNRELCLRFLCMLCGSALAAAGFASCLALGLLEGPLFGFLGGAVALVGGAICAGGLMFGAQRGVAEPGWA